MTDKIQGDDLAVTDSGEDLGEQGGQGTDWDEMMGEGIPYADELNDMIGQRVVALSLHDKMPEVVLPAFKEYALAVIDMLHGSKVDDSKVDDSIGKTRSQIGVVGDVEADKDQVARRYVAARAALDLKLSEVGYKLDDADFVECLAEGGKNSVNIRFKSMPDKYVGNVLLVLTDDVDSEREIYAD